MRSNPIQSVVHPGPEPENSEISVIVPAFNEDQAIGKTVDDILECLNRQGISFEVIVVDDGSTDDTAELAAERGARVIRSEENLGYGASLKKGIAAGTSDYVAIVDADGTYPIDVLPQMLALARNADMVVGDRGKAMKNVPILRRPAKWFLNLLANYLAQRKIPDVNSGLRVFRRSALINFIALLPDGFSFTTTITLCMLCTGYSVVYLPISYDKRIGRSKIRASDFFNFVLLVFRATVLFNPLRVFIPDWNVVFLAGVMKLVYDLFIGDLSESAIFGLLAAVMIWSLGLLADMIARLHLRPMNFGSDMVRSRQTQVGREDGQGP